MKAVFRGDRLFVNKLQQFSSLGTIHLLIETFSYNVSCRKKPVKPKPRKTKKHHKKAKRKKASDEHEKSDNSSAEQQSSKGIFFPSNVCYVSRIPTFEVSLSVAQFVFLVISFHSTYNCTFKRFFLSRFFSTLAVCSNNTRS